MTHSMFQQWGVLLTIGALVATAAQGQPGPGGFPGFPGGTATRSTSLSRSTTYPSSTDIGQARITYDSETRSLIVVADEATAEHITNIVSQLDRPAPQVLIKVVFLEVTYTKGSDIGISGWHTRPFGPNNIYTGIVNQAFAGLPGLTSGAGFYQVLASDFQATLRAIAEAGKIEVLSRPSILARNNQPATITIGQQVPLITNVRYDTFGNQINAITYQNVGIILTVTPFITSDGMVEMILAPQISSLSESSVNIATGTNAVAAPVINLRSADTVVVTPDGQTVIIGGLMSNRKAESTSKIPLLGDIPLLGAAFRRKVTDNEKTELLIFLTPKIVLHPRELALLTESEKGQTQYAPHAFSEQELDRFLNNLPASGTAAPKPRRK